MKLKKTIEYYHKQSNEAIKAKNFLGEHQANFKIKTGVLQICVLDSSALSFGTPH